jgi:hypothetical protein
MVAIDRKINDHSLNIPIACGLVHGVMPGAENFLLEGFCFPFGK